MHEAAAKLNSVSESDLDSLISLSEVNQTGVKSYFESPVDLEKKHIYPVKNYGSALAPFYIPISLWIGGIIAVAMLTMNLDDADETCDIGEALLQEIVDGVSVSASVMAGEEGAQTILTSRQIIGDVKLGQMEPYGYCGNLAPYPLPLEVELIAEEVVETLKLTGSNGVDMIRSHDETYVIEVNPRFQGTFECAEAWGLSSSRSSSRVFLCFGMCLLRLNICFFTSLSARLGSVIC